MKHAITTRIEINADPQTIWDVLTSFDTYESWNPFIVKSEGEPLVGTRLTHRIQPVGGKAMTIRPTVTEANPGRTFEWLGRLGLPGIFDGRHRFEIEQLAPGRCRLDHTEAFSGILVRPLRRSLDTNTLAGFESMNLALKARVERLHPTTHDEELTHC